MRPERLAPEAEILPSTFPMTTPRKAVVAVLHEALREAVSPFSTRP